MKKKRISLSTQINVIFTLITLITSVLFIIIFRQTINNFTNNQAEKHFRLYHETLSKVIDGPKEKYPLTTNYAYGYYRVDNQYEIVEIIGFDYRNFASDDLAKEIIKKYFLDNTEALQQSNNDFEDRRYKDTDYYLKYDSIDNDEYYVLITMSDGSYADSLREPISNIISIGFVSIIILGNAIILLWSSVTVDRIKKLEKEVSILGSSDYKNKVSVEGSDEIAELAYAIDIMRDEILKNESVKQEMLQNISHDIKTPIAVIQSYAEAIKDGITDVSDLDIILIQVQILNKKVRQLLEWNKLEYVKSKEDYYEVNMKEVIETVVNNHKYQNNITFSLDLDESTFKGLIDNYYSVVSNIIENALRYAKKAIKVTLKNKRLTISNDGEPISEEFINSVFKPYEKGHKGQFGLGMTIVQRTINNFGLKLTIENNNEGVSFIIEPRE
ncbi:sensor histidine kinase [Haploplasma axanthum]|uniref:histidine kinase n=1 Tax=Haploplasma axanthum TaxID=29552 RepID=A0A449BBD7_HAPAX|nr:HAMP domain-containing sensor histidine kinase [Haploplasma axanthum]VEU79733.1 Sensor histidine kinase CssS [Haploplasma axanthum]